MGSENTAKREPARAARAGRILVIEDEANIMEALGFVLSRAGWDVRGHGRGETALAEVARVAPDMVVLDVMLPGRSGFEILRDLRKGALTARLPVLMLTAKGQSKDREQALALGADGFLTKPFANAELLDAVARLVGAGAGPGAGTEAGPESDPDAGAGAGREAGPDGRG